MSWAYVGGTGLRRARLTFTVAVLSLLLFPMALQTTYASERDEEYHRDYIYGVPADPSEAWTLASGARLYDNWISSLDAEAPEATHPATVSSGTPA